MAKFTLYMKSGDTVVVRAMKLPTVTYLKAIGISWDNVQFLQRMIGMSSSGVS